MDLVSERRQKEIEIWRKKKLSIDLCVNRLQQNQVRLSYLRGFLTSNFYTRIPAEAEESKRNRTEYARTLRLTQNVFAR